MSSITGVRDYYFLANNDEGTPFDVSKLGGTLLPDYKQISEELKVSSKVDDLVDYQAGIYLLDKSMTRDSRSGFGDDAGAWFASGQQYTRLDASSPGRQLLKDSLSGMTRSAPERIENKTASIFGEAKWKLTDALFLTTGLRGSYELRDYASERFIDNQGFGSALNRVALGGFDSNATTGALTPAALADANQTALANSVALKYFGVADYTLLNGTQQRQVADAKAIRNQNQGVLWNKFKVKSLESFQPTYLVSPSYKFTEDLTGYLSYQHGEKAGISIVVNAVPFEIKPERIDSFEVGFKSSLLEKTLVFNTNFFWTEINNYQQAAQVLDEFTTNERRKTDPNAEPVYVGTTGNAAGVRALGVEVDGAYSGIPYTLINFSGAFNDAVYTDFKNLAKAAELNWTGSPAFRDATGERLPGAAQFTFTISPEFRFPLQLVNNSLGGEFHTSFTTLFTSSYKSDNSLSDYSDIKANSTTDFSVGVGRRDKLFDISLVGKNVFNNKAFNGLTWNSYQPGVPQWFGVMVSGKL